MRQFGGIARFSAFGLSRAEVIMKFQEIVSETDFVREAQQWPILTAEMEKDSTYFQLWFSSRISSPKRIDRKTHSQGRNLASFTMAGNAIRTNFEEAQGLLHSGV
jgi:hypothetical protein